VDRWTGRYGPYKGPVPVQRSDGRWTVGPEALERRPTVVRPTVNSRMNVSTKPIRPRQRRLRLRGARRDTNLTPNIDPETGEAAWDRDDRLWCEAQERRRQRYVWDEAHDTPESASPKRLGPSTEGNTNAAR
jgi:hypothetical protein